MGDRAQELKVEEVVYWPHQVSGTNAEPWSSGGSRYGGQARGNRRTEEIMWKDFCLFV